MRCCRFLLAKRADATVGSMGSVRNFGKFPEVLNVLAVTSGGDRANLWLQSVDIPSMAHRQRGRNRPQSGGTDWGFGNSSYTVCPTLGYVG